MQPFVKPLDGPFGIQIDDLDIGRDDLAAAGQFVAEMLSAHGLVLLRGQDPTEERFVEFSRSIREVECHWLGQYSRPGRPEILVVSNVVENGVNIGLMDAGRYWHSDLSYKPQPSSGAVLWAREVPTRNGTALGDTLFANVVLAYSALPDEVKSRIEPLQAAFNLRKRQQRLQREGAQYQGVSASAVASIDDVVRRVVQCHPVTGAKLIYVNDAHTARLLGLPDNEAQALLDFLVEHCQRPEFVYRHSWQVNDMLIWDNYATQHLAVNDYALPDRRRMYRTTLTGIPFPALV
jgi:taurine dioxygenase